MRSRRQSERFEGLPQIALTGGLTLVEASTRGSRRRGLAHLDALPADQGLLIPRCRAVHTVGMRFALDLIWLGRYGEILRVDRDIPALRMRACPRARAVVETLAGEVDGFVSGLTAADRPLAAQFRAPPRPWIRSRSSGGFSMIWENRTTVTVSSIVTLRP